MKISNIKVVRRTYNELLDIKRNESENFKRLSKLRNNDAVIQHFYDEKLLSLIEDEYKDDFAFQTARKELEELKKNPLVIEYYKLCYLLRKVEKKSFDKLVDVAFEKVNSDVSDSYFLHCCKYKPADSDIMMHILRNLDTGFDVEVRDSVYPSFKERAGKIIEYSSINNGKISVDDIQYMYRKTILTSEINNSEDAIENADKMFEKLLSNK